MENTKKKMMMKIEKEEQKNTKKMMMMTMKKSRSIDSIERRRGCGVVLSIKVCAMLDACSHSTQALLASGSCKEGFAMQASSLPPPLPPLLLSLPSPQTSFGRRPSPLRCSLRPSSPRALLNRRGNRAQKVPEKTKEEEKMKQEEEKKMEKEEAKKNKKKVFQWWAGL
jgi:hypothetical protein